MIFPTTFLHLILLVESFLLFLCVRRLRDTGDFLLREQKLQLKASSTQKTSTDFAIPMIYVVTPTYTRPTQLPDLTRLANTLRLVPRIHWIVAEDRNTTTKPVADLLAASKLRFTHLAAERPHELIGKVIGRGVFNRRAALDWIRTYAEPSGVIYFADDDNSYDVRIFEEIRQTRVVAVFPVGLVLKFGISSPIVRQGTVIGFFDAFLGGRKFAMDMAGFSVSVKHLNSKPLATFPAAVSWLEEGFMRSLEVEKDDLEPKAESCTRVWVWHTRTEKAAEPKLQHLQGFHC
ncbi:galactosylgalactosylxylosylprotein 3-beta-glucuronosyltransferase S [Eurytemora carolleeae]|uniref:galactosylgalactosylxylosylprotein 3-beta-glucuronosyltransferase S n=1 Tax=Eurytemora carolleeae TaxID=1294199 RepID=UPI000C78BADD|nr:galactosylgalactosylxylosylprotein 3-beta-glucuronosyltransferase S [Eurytemora carolleeae]|eukprot:XP_023334420.1 galactosylgalactosylxylosylprotein 3-beta-glucuronosyltransferase S-like [Eurytemora affinis]